MRLGFLPARRQSQRSPSTARATRARSAPTAGSPHPTMSPSTRRGASGSPPTARTIAAGFNDSLYAAQVSGPGRGATRCFFNGPAAARSAARASRPTARRCSSRSSIPATTRARLSRSPRRAGRISRRHAAALGGAGDHAQRRRRDRRVDYRRDTRERMARSLHRASAAKRSVLLSDASRQRFGAITQCVRSFFSDRGLLMPTIPIPSTAKDELTPTRRLRAGINFQNHLLTTLGSNGEQGGVAVEFARELAHRLDVVLEIIPYRSAGALADSVRSGEWDIAVLGDEPRARQGDRLCIAIDGNRSDLPGAGRFDATQRGRSGPCRHTHRVACEKRVRSVFEPHHRTRAVGADRRHCSGERTFRA